MTIIPFGRPRAPGDRPPARPGPGPMPAQVLCALDLTIGRRIDGLLAGDYRSMARGAGYELEQIREYEPGDDVRRIDWNVTARTRVPHTRLYVAERALTTWLLLDLSASMTFGTADRRKADVAEGAALAAGHMATRHGNRLGIITFGGPQQMVHPARQGRRGLIELLTALRMEPAWEGPGAGSLADALQRVSFLAHQRGVVAIVSDLRSPRDWKAALLQVASRQHVLAIEVQDPREQSLPDVGDLWLVDPESGRQLRVDTSRRSVRERFADAAAEERRSLAADIQATGAKHVVLSTSGDWLRTFIMALRIRGPQP